MRSLTVPKHDNQLYIFNDIDDLFLGEIIILVRTLANKSPVWRNRAMINVGSSSMAVHQKNIFTQALYYIWYGTFGCLQNLKYVKHAWENTTLLSCVIKMRPSRDLLYNNVQDSELVIYSRRSDSPHNLYKHGHLEAPFYYIMDYHLQMQHNVWSFAVIQACHKEK